MKTKVIWILEGIPVTYGMVDTLLLYFSSTRKLIRYLKSKNARLKFTDSKEVSRYNSDEFIYFTHKELLN